MSAFAPNAGLPPAKCKSAAGAAAHLRHGWPDLLQKSAQGVQVLRHLNCRSHGGRPLLANRTGGVDWATGENWREFRLIAGVEVVTKVELRVRCIRGLQMACCGGPARCERRCGQQSVQLVLLLLHPLFQWRLNLALHAYLSLGISCRHLDVSSHLAFNDSS